MAPAAMHTPPIEVLEREKNAGQKNGSCGKTLSGALPNTRPNLIFLPTSFLPMIFPLFGPNPGISLATPQGTPGLSLW